LVYFSPFWHVVPRKIWQPWLDVRHFVVSQLDFRHFQLFIRKLKVRHIYLKNYASCIYLPIYPIFNEITGGQKFWSKIKIHPRVRAFVPEGRNGQIREFSPEFWEEFVFEIFCLDFPE
jgi:hypothetical protein